MNKKERKIKFLEIHLKIYRIAVVVFIGATKKEIMQVANKRGVTITEKWGKDFDEVYNDTRANGFCMELGDDNCDLLVYLKKFPRKASEYGTLYHELWHATYEIIKSRNLWKEEESPAFIYEYLATECNRNFWGKKKF